jgi:hypothetical protein
MFSRNESCDAKWAQNDVNFGATLGDGGNRIPTDAYECGHVMCRVQTKAAGPSSGEIQKIVKLYSKPLKASTETKTKTVTKTARRKTVQWILVLSPETFNNIESMVAVVVVVEVKVMVKAVALVEVHILTILCCIIL